MFRTFKVDSGGIIQGLGRKRSPAAARQRMVRVTNCGERNSSKRIAVFASGAGSNFKKIHEACLTKRINGSVVLLVTNHPDCPAASFASSEGIPVYVYPREGNTSDANIDLFRTIKDEYKVDIGLCAGYLRHIPAENVDVKEYPNKILNIHPSLLPAFGGKGFYGMRVHKAVLKSGAKYSGPTVHFVAGKYDEGPILDQRVVPVLIDDTPESLADRVLQQVTT